MKTFGKIAIRSTALVLLLATALSLTSCITLMTRVVGAIKEENEREEPLTPDTVLHSSYHELDLKGYVKREFDYSHIKLSRTEIEGMIGEDFVSLAKGDPDFDKYMDANTDDEMRLVLREAIILRNTSYKSYDDFFNAKYEKYLRDLAFEACIEMLEINAHEDGSFTEEGMAVEFLFRDFNLTLTYGDFARLYVMAMDSSGNIAIFNPGFSSEDSSSAIIGGVDSSDTVIKFETIMSGDGTYPDDEKILAVQKYRVKEELVRHITVTTD